MRFEQIASLALAATVVSAQGPTGGNTTSTNGTVVPYEDDDLTSFWALLQQFNLLSTVSNLRNVTILAPSNEALAALTSSGVNITPDLVGAIINYHTLNGTIRSTDLSNVTAAFAPTHLTNPAYSNVTGGQVVEAILVADDGPDDDGPDDADDAYFFSGLRNNISATDVDNDFAGGVIHIVNGVLTIPGNLTSTLTETNLTALAGAVQTLNLTSVLSGLTDVTIFAPNNNAFQEIGTFLANASATDLIGVLGYHVVNNSVLYSTDITETSTTIPTFVGGNLNVQLVNGTYFVDSARIINPNILFSGGVIHVIDRVLNPANVAPADNGTATTTSQLFPATTRASNVPFTSGQATPTGANNAQNPPAAGGVGGVGGAGGSTPTSTAGANAFATGAVGAAALFGGLGAMLANL